MVNLILRVCRFQLLLVGWLCDVGDLFDGGHYQSQLLFFVQAFGCLIINKMIGTQINAECKCTSTQVGERLAAAKN